MSVSHGIKLSGITIHVAMLALCGFIAAPRISVGQPATDAQVEGTADEGDLRWKPHRFATAPLRGPASDLVRTDSGYQSAAGFGQFARSRARRHTAADSSSDPGNRRIRTAAWLPGSRYAADGRLDRLQQRTSPAGGHDAL
jgi:hypothetical protein